MKSASDVGHLGFDVGATDFAAELGVAVVADGPDPTDDVCEFRIAGTVTEGGFDVVAFGGEEAGEEVAVGGESDPIAIGAEWLADRGDKANFLIGKIFVSEPTGGFPDMHWLEGFEGEMLM